MKSLYKSIVSNDLFERKIGTKISDTNGNELLNLTATSSAVNELTLANAATGNNPSFTASGGDTNIGVSILPKGSGQVTIDNLTFPAADGSSGQALVTNGSGALSFSSVGRTGTVNWQTTPKTGTFTAANGEGYFANTSGSAFNMNLPAGSAGHIVSVADYAESFASNNLTIVPNGSDKIGSQNQNATLSTKGQSVTLVYVDSTQGWINTMDSTSNVRGVNPYIVASGGTITTVDTDYKVHTFTGPGTFTVCNAGTCAGSNKVDYLVIAGGGGGSRVGGDPQGGAGGGGGGFRESVPSPAAWTVSPLANPGNARPVSVQGYPITVGGSASPTTFSDITSTRGGPGGGFIGTPGTSGGSGGGGGAQGGGGGSGNSPPVSPPQGNSGSPAPSPTTPGAGGGAGGGASGTTAGAQITTNITGSSVGYSGGGANGTGAGPSPGGGGPSGGARGTNGATNTGGGGGGQNGPGGPSAGSGGSGIVVIRYKFQN